MNAQTRKSDGGEVAKLSVKGECGGFGESVAYSKAMNIISMQHKPPIEPSDPQKAAKSFTLDLIQASPQRIWLNDIAFSNINSMLVTWDTSQSDIF